MNKVVKGKVVNIFMEESNKVEVFIEGVKGDEMLLETNEDSISDLRVGEMVEFNAVVKQVVDGVEIIEGYIN